jgi:hypothetical protein
MKLQAWSFGDVHFELVEVAYKNKKKNTKLCP